MLKDGWQGLAERPIVWVSIKIILSIGLIAVVALLLQQPLLIGPFGSSCGLLFSVPQATPIAHVRNMVIGHMVAVGVGLAVSYSLGFNMWSITLAGLLTMWLMEWFSAIHPPAYATALMAVSGAAKVFFVVDVGVAVLVLVVTKYVLDWCQQHYSKCSSLKGV